MYAAKYQRNLRFFCMGIKIKKNGESPFHPFIQVFPWKGCRGCEACAPLLLPWIWL